MVPKNTSLGFYNNDPKIYACNNSGTLITEDVLRFSEGEILTNRLFIPAMFTKDVYVMKEDCLGYIMERMVAL